MKRLVNARLLVERETRIHLSRNLARHNLQDLATELHKQVVDGRINLDVDVLAAVLLAVLDSLINELRILGLLGRSEDERRVGGGVLRLVLLDGGEVTGVSDDGL